MNGDNMFIQLQDVNKEGTLNDSIFILQTREAEPKFISRSFADHDVNKYTSKNEGHAIVYFNSQAATQALNTDFKFSNLLVEMRRIPINEYHKIKAKEADGVRRLAKIEARRKREPKPWK